MKYLPLLFHCNLTAKALAQKWNIGILTSWNRQVKAPVSSCSGKVPPSPSWCLISETTSLFGFGGTTFNLKKCFRRCLMTTPQSRAVSHSCIPSVQPANHYTSGSNPIFFLKNKEMHKKSQGQTATHLSDLVPRSWLYLQTSPTQHR